MKFDDRAFIMNEKLWAGETCCLKKLPQPAEKLGVTGYADFGVITTSRFPIDVWRRDGSLAGHYGTIDELLADGWIVD